MKSTHAWAELREQQALARFTNLRMLVRDTTYCRVSAATFNLLAIDHDFGHRGGHVQYDLASARHQAHLAELQQDELDFANSQQPVRGADIPRICSAELGLESLYGSK